LASAEFVVNNKTFSNKSVSIYGKL